MKIELSNKEFTILNDLAIAVGEQPINDVEDVMSITHTANNAVIEIDETYVTSVYGECGKWPPNIICSCKGLIVLLKTFYDSLSERESKAIEEIKSKKKIKKENKSEVENKS